jgi:hypothetical protein
MKFLRIFPGTATIRPSWIEKTDVEIPSTRP